MKAQETARLFYREIQKIDDNKQVTTKEKVEALYRLLNLIFIETTQQEKLQFTTLFARIAFACQKYEVSRQMQFFIHSFRKAATKYLHQNAPERPAEEMEQDYHLGLKVVAETVSILFKIPLSVEMEHIVPKQLSISFSPVKVKAFSAKIRVVALEDDFAKEQLIVQDENQPGEKIRVQYNIADRNENFTSTIDAIRRTFGFPININLIDVEIDANNIYRPKAFVLEPDYLVDVSAVSECFKDFGAEPLLYLSKKFLPFKISAPLMIGNIANYFLDELMTNPEAKFNEIFPKVFQLNPLAFSLMENSEIRSIMQKSQRHFVTLKTMVHQEFSRFQIQPEDCFLEPSFYSESYGLQGRLDVFYQNPDGSKKAAIVELKSGSPFKPNKHGISQNHYTQTLLYDLIIRSTFDNQLDPANYILYSGQQMRQLRYAPVTKAQQYEAIQIRNQLVALERTLSNFGKEGRLESLELQGNQLFRKLSPNRFPYVKGFVAKDLESFEKAYSNMSPLERQYFVAFSGLIAREHQLAKTGIQGINNINGLAALWLNAYEEKENNFDLIGSLTIIENNSKAEEPLIVFQKTAQTNPLANFRQGDISVLYPSSISADDERENTVLNNQIFKCTIVEITPKTITVRLRSRQFNTSIFEKYEYWNIEHDLLDSSYTAMYRGLFQFIQFPQEKKDLLLTLRPPHQPEPQEVIASQELTKEQQTIFKKIIQAQDYFLLWGPPGTGKTSMMLKHIVGHLLNNTDENLLLLAYTNRAVDEICEAIEQLATYAGKPIQDAYLRIGSRYSTAAHFQSQLLNAKISKVANRQRVKDILASHRVFVSTVSSIGSKPELMQLKKFDRVIIDEASQILEPNLVGLLPHFKRFVLIGDHQQLPAVVVQDAEASNVETEELHKIGLHNLRNSLFERLYKRCIDNGWDWAYAQLSHQGRMHVDIMDFPNRHFYQGNLKILPPEIPFHKTQLQTVDYQPLTNPTLLEKQLLEKRILFIPTSSDAFSGTSKINRYEAQKVGELIASFKNIYAANERQLTPSCIGVITPYRAQIAQIRDVLSTKEEDYSWLSIDTVERYQGGARDIILISLCTNSANQLESLVSLSDEGVDRKLNVALTRARKHLVILGNPELLRRSPIYEALIGYCGV